MFQQSMKLLLKVNAQRIREEWCDYESEVVYCMLYLLQNNRLVSIIIGMAYYSGLVFPSNNISLL